MRGTARLEMDTDLTNKLMAYAKRLCTHRSSSSTSACAPCEAQHALQLIWYSPFAQRWHAHTSTRLGECNMCVCACVCVRVCVLLWCITCVCMCVCLCVGVCGWVRQVCIALHFLRWCSCSLAKDCTRTYQSQHCSFTVLSYLLVCLCFAVQEIYFKPVYCKAIRISPHTATQQQLQDFM
jgi:hypothetical protein